MKLKDKYKEFIIEFSKLYPDYEFHFTGLNDFAGGLPEVVTIVNSDISKEDIFKVELEFGDMLDEVLDSEDVREYDGATFVIESDFDKNWLWNDEPFFRIKNGVFTATRSIKEIIAELIEDFREFYSDEEREQTYLDYCTNDTEYLVGCLLDRGSLELENESETDVVLKYFNWR